MPIDLSVLCRQVTPENAVLILGAGASIPSGGPSGQELANELSDHFQIGKGLGLSLSDLTTLIERRRTRRELVEFICKRVERLQPTGGLLNLPMLGWSSIFSTNYDDLVEKAFKKTSIPLSVYSSNYDFTAAGEAPGQSLYKFHGTIWKDESLGFKERMVITEPDFDKVEDYRSVLYRRLADFLHTKSVLIVGNSLVDPDLKRLVDDALRAKSSQGAPGKIYLFVYSPNPDMAEIYESRGVSVCFGGIDDLAFSLIKASPSEQLVLSVTSDVLDVAPALHSCTFSVRTQLNNETGNLAKMFNGRPATYGDIKSGWTFERDVVAKIETQFVSEGGKPFALVLGAAGVGKSSAARSILHLLDGRDVPCWEHKGDFELDDNSWIKVNDELGKRSQIGILLVDDAHNHLRQLNRLIERLAGSEKQCLGLLLVSSKAHWNPRIKSPHLFPNSETYELSRLSDSELMRLLDLLDQRHEIRALVESSFLGYSRNQRLDRLRQRCDADMFVCLKNIFGFQSIDQIILEEFNSLSDDLQQIYRQVGGMQAIGVRVHRELVRRITGLQANQIARTLDDLDGIIEEYEVSQRNGIYGWRLRHQIISLLIAKYKFSSQDDIYDLFDLVISSINPTYQLEVQSISDMCDLDTGVVRIANQGRQNVLLRKMITLAPSERVPRHRLIHNLIDMGEFEIAEAEIKSFEKDIKTDGPLLRYKVRLKLGLARQMPGISDGDRASIVLEGASIAENAIRKFPDDKNIFRAHLDCGIAYYKYTGKADVFERAMSLALEAQSRILDPDLRSIISKYVRISDEIGMRVDLDDRVRQEMANAPKDADED